MTNQTQIIRSALDTSVGTKFLSINNDDLLACVRSAASNADIKTIVSKRSDRHLLIQARLTDRTIDIPDLGGVHTPMIWVRNSNAGTAALRVGIGWYRFVCSNGLLLGLDAFDVRLRHIDGPTAHAVLDHLPGAIAEAVRAIETGSALDQAFEALHTPVLDPISIVGHLPDLSDRTKQSVISAILDQRYRKVDHPTNVWGLYNLTNEFARIHSRSAYRSAVQDIGRLEHIMTLADDQAALAAGDAA